MRIRQTENPDRRLAAMICILLFFSTTISINKIHAYAASVPSISYEVHSQNYGWLGQVTNGATAGTTNKAKQMEALKINLKHNRSSMVSYRVHIGDIGWQSWKSSGKMAGTTNQGRRIEAVQIKLTGTYAGLYDIFYRVHVAQKGWLGWAKNGETAGSTGISLRAEAIQIKLAKKGTVHADGKTASLKMPSLTYRGHVQYLDWQNAVGSGKTAGTTGRGYRLEALQIHLKDSEGKSGISYRAHVAGVGWQEWKHSGQTMGTTNQARAIEAVEIKLTGDLASYLDIYYRMHVSGIGWMGWAKNGASAGTTGGGINGEAIEIKLVGKDAPVDTKGTPFKHYSQDTASKTASNPYPSRQNVDGDNYYEIPCTRFAWQKVYDTLGISLPAWGNGGQWLDQARNSGYAVGKTAKANSIAVWQDSGYGHVAFVTAVDGTNMWVDEGGRTDLDHTSSHGVATGFKITSSVGSYRNKGTQRLVGFIYLIS